jgi:hypothetical protein
MGGVGLYGRPELACDSAGPLETSEPRRAAIKAPTPHHPHSRPYVYVFIASIL